jgi:hypothetical protein
VQLSRQRISAAGGSRYRGQQAGDPIFHPHQGVAIDPHHVRR